MSMGVHTCNPSTGEADHRRIAERSQVSGQHGLNSKNMSEKKKKEGREGERKREREERREKKREEESSCFMGINLDILPISSLLKLSPTWFERLSMTLVSQLLL
jgi:hypothetical protein